MTHARYRSLVDKLLFEELKMDSGQWKVNVSTAWIYLKYIAEGDTTTVNCQLSIFHCAASNNNLSDCYAQTKASPV
jgi:hypothetical protein